MCGVQRRAGKILSTWDLGLNFVADDNDDDDNDDMFVHIVSTPIKSSLQ